MEFKIMKAISQIATLSTVDKNMVSWLLNDFTQTSPINQVLTLVSWLVLKIFLHTVSQANKPPCKEASKPHTSSIREECDPPGDSDIQKDFTEKHPFLAHLYTIQ